MATTISSELRVSNRSGASAQPRSPHTATPSGMSPEGKAATAVGSFLIVAGFVLGLLGYLPAFTLEFLGLPLIVWGGSTGMQSQAASR